jgi:hypothetical protein
MRAAIVDQLAERDVEGRDELAKSGGGVSDVLGVAG